MNNKTKIRVVTLIVVTILLLFLISFGYFYVSSNQSDRNRLTGGCFNTSFSDQNSINLTGAMPEAFDDAKKNTPYEFTLTNTCDLPVKYYILLNVKSSSFNPDFINFSMNDYNYNNLSNVLQNTNRFVIDSGYNNSYIIDSGLLKTGSITKNIRLWIDESVSLSDLQNNSSFTAQVKVVGEVSSQLATDKIKNIVKDSDDTSIDVINKGTIGSGTNACTNTLAYDGTSDKNLRYVGAKPCNYISFNNELWRIIGVMNNIDNGSGKKETRLKIVRNEVFSLYSWDSSSYDINDGFGVNDWTQADLMYEYNGDYLNSNLNENTLWYTGDSNLKEGIFYHTSKLDKEAQNLIENAVWYLGDISLDELHNHGTASFYYNRRLEPNIHGNNSWIGKVALMDPSDFIYSTAGSSTTSRSTCLNISNWDWDTSSSGYDCSDTYLIERSTWLLNCINYNSYGCLFLQAETNRISATKVSRGLDNAGRAFNSNPTVYLKSNISITGGNGNITNPYTIE